MKLGFIEILKVILIGIIEGITEWLPISSTGHMLLFDAFIPLEMSEDFKEMFFVVIQLGAIIAVVVMFWKKLFPFTVADNKIGINKDIISMWLKVVAGCIPAAILGLVLDDFLEAYFGNAFTISVMLILYGIAFILVEIRNKNKTPKINSITNIDYKTALIIGLFQALSMIPGTSRSGATIIGALLIGVSRTAAAEFTFFLAIPTMLGASALKILKFGFDFTGAEISVLIIGMVVAFAVSLFAIKFLIEYVRKHDFRVFGYYRIVLGLIVILASVISKNI
jgi:undecaprenyl-diphosphatase